MINKTNMIRATTEGVVLALSEILGPILPKCEVNRDIIFMPDDLALRFRAELEKRGPVTGADGKETPTDKYTLEFMNVWLYDLNFPWGRNRTPMARTGIATEFGDRTAGGKEFVKMHRVMPVNMEFGVTFWTKYKERMDQFIEEFVYWQQTNPVIELYWDDNKPLRLQIAIDSPVGMDVSKISNMFQEGKYWKHTFRFKVESWLIKDVPVRTLKKIILDMYAVSIFPEPPAQIPEALALHEELEAVFLNVAFMVGDTDSITAEEKALKDYMVARGHTVTCVETLTLIQANTYDVVVVGEAHESTDLSALKATTAGVLLLCSNTSFGFGDLTATAITDWTVDVITNKHYITEEYGIAKVEVLDKDEITSDIRGFNRFHGFEEELGRYGIGVCDTGKALRDGSLAPARRVICGIYQFNYANKYGRDFVNRSLRWAGKIEKDVDELAET